MERGRVQGDHRRWGALMTGVKLMMMMMEMMTSHRWSIVGVEQLIQIKVACDLKQVDLFLIEKDSFACDSIHTHTQTHTHTFLPSDFWLGHSVSTASQIEGRTVLDLDEWSFWRQEYGRHESVCCRRGGFTFYHSNSDKSKNHHQQEQTKQNN